MRCVSCRFDCLLMLALLLGLVVFPCVLQADEPEENFVPIFNGVDFTGWKTSGTEGYRVEEGKIIAHKGNLVTEKHYSDFILRFEFRLPENGNNGIGIRNAMEIQILDDTGPKHKNIKPWQFHGSIYGVVPAQPGSLKPVGEWNVQEILAQGNHLRVTVNGQVIVDADLKAALEQGPLDGKPHNNLLSPTGPITLRGHNSSVEFRNLRVKELQ